MNRLFARKLLTACAIGCMATIAIADGPPVQLHIDDPNSNGGLALLSESGWRKFSNLCNTTRLCDS